MIKFKRDTNMQLEITGEKAYVLTLRVEGGRHRGSDLLVLYHDHTVAICREKKRRVKR